MAVARLPVVLDDDVRVRLEDGDELLGGRHLLAVEHAALRLVEHPVHPRQKRAKLRREGFEDDDPGGSLDDASGVVPDYPRYAEQVAVLRHHVLATAMKLDHVGAPPCSASVIGEECAHRRLVLSDSVHQPRRDADAVPQQARIGRLMDGRIHDRRVAPDRAPPLDALLLRETDQDPVDRFPRLGPDPLHVGLEALVTRPVPEAQPHEGSEGRGILKVELQLPVAQAVDLLQQGDPQHLVPSAPISGRASRILAAICSSRVC